MDYNVLVQKLGYESAKNDDTVQNYIGFRKALLKGITTQNKGLSNRLKDLVATFIETKRKETLNASDFVMICLYLDVQDIESLKPILD